MSETINLSYQGQSETYSEDSLSIRHTYIGTQAQIDTFISQHKPLLGTKVEGLGELTSLSKSQEDGPFWKVEVEYTDRENQGISIEQPDDSYGVKSATLKGGLLQIDFDSPIMRDKYRFCWNHDLYAQVEYPSSATWSDYIPPRPQWFSLVIKPEVMIGLPGKEWTSSTPDYVINYIWVSDPSELPQDPQPKTKGYKSQIVCVATRTKPGYDKIDWATYQVVESAKFRNPKDAGQFVSNTLNHLATPENDFGLDFIVNWKCDDASVQWTGKYWLATVTWTGSPDPKGWDTDWYDPITDKNPNWTLADYGA